jgi:hypothetical protein
MSLNYLSSFFYSQKEELSDDELSEDISSGEDISDENLSVGDASSGIEDLEEEDLEDLEEEDLAEEDLEDLEEEDLVEEEYGFGNESPIPEENTKLLKVPKITITETVNQRNVYKEYQTYRSKRLFEATKSLLNNFKFSFKRMMVYNAVKNKAEADSAKEWMAAYKIQQYWKNRKKNKNKKKLINYYK